MQKKSLGQNFLKDRAILKKIADFAEIEKTDTLIEVGPGEGTLTEFLIEKAGKVIAVEKDEKLAEALQEKFAAQYESSKLQIVAQDILEYEITEPKYKLVGNIPYYLTGALFKKSLEAPKQPVSLTFVVQKEVADRILARDGKESILSISIKVYGRPQYGGLIKAGSFSPPPKVDSALISIREVSKGRFAQAQVDEKHFFEVLRAGFSHKRKVLLKNLMGLQKERGEAPLPAEEMKKIMKRCDIPEKARAENLSVDQWLSLASALR